MYTTLTNRFGLVENQENTEDAWKYFNHIVAIAPLGVTNLGLDLNNSGGNSNQDYFTKIPYGIIDNIGSCYNLSDHDYYTKNTIKLILDNFAGKDTSLYSQGYRALDSLDNLFVYVTGHGKSTGSNSYINMEKSGVSTYTELFDYELAEWLNDINCAQMTFLFQPCHSGGFIDDIMDVTNAKCKNRVAYSSTSDENMAYSECYINSLLSPEFDIRDSSDDYMCAEYT